LNRRRKVPVERSRASSFMPSSARGGALGADAEQLAVHVDVDACGVDAGQVGVQHVAVGVNGRDRSA